MTKVSCKFASDFPIHSVEANLVSLKCLVSFRSKKVSFQRMFRFDGRRVSMRWNESLREMLRSLLW